MDNPWSQLPNESPFLLPDDRPIVMKVNQTADSACVIHSELLPEPYIGHPDAPIVLLSLNPGFSSDDAAFHTDPTFAATCRANLLHQALPYPFYHLNPRWRSPGATWWTKKLKQLVTTYPREQVARTIVCIEYFPYHSERFAHHQIVVPSQYYSWELVRNAMTRQAVIILTRSAPLWFRVVPALQTYPNLYRVRNVRNPTISPGNCPEAYQRICQYLEGQR